MTTNLAVSPHLEWEPVGSDIVIFEREKKKVIRLNTEAAEAFRAVHGGLNDSAISDELLGWMVDQGIFVESGSSLLSRRAILRASAVGLGASVVALSLPTVAAASSGIPVSGDWNRDGLGVLSIAVFGFDFPNLGDRLVDTQPAGPTPPSSMQIDGFGTPIPASLWLSSSDADNDAVNWTLNSAPSFFDTPRTITGRFTWGGTSYFATLVHVP